MPKHVQYSFTSSETMRLVRTDGCQTERTTSAHCDLNVSIQRVFHVQALGQRLGCQTERYNISTQSMVRCIRGQRLDRLVTSSAVLFPRQVALSLVDYTWAPVTDGLLVTDLTTATAFPGPLLAGLVSNEGACLTNWTVSC